MTESTAFSHTQRIVNFLSIPLEEYDFTKNIIDNYTHIKLQIVDRFEGNIGCTIDEIAALKQNSEHFEKILEKLYLQTGEKEVAKTFSEKWGESISRRNFTKKKKFYQFLLQIKDPDSTMMVKILRACSKESAELAIHEFERIFSPYCTIKHSNVNKHIVVIKGLKGDNKQYQVVHQMECSSRYFSLSWQFVIHQNYTKNKVHFKVFITKISWKKGELESEIDEAIRPILLRYSSDSISETINEDNNLNDSELDPQCIGSPNFSDNFQSTSSDNNQTTPKKGGWNLQKQKKEKVTSPTNSIIGHNRTPSINSPSSQPPQLSVTSISNQSSTSAISLKEICYEETEIPPFSHPATDDFDDFESNDTNNPFVKFAHTLLLPGESIQALHRVSLEFTELINSDKEIQESQSTSKPDEKKKNIYKRIVGGKNSNLNFKKEKKSKKFSIPGSLVLTNYQIIFISVNYLENESNIALYTKPVTSSNSNSSLSIKSPLSQSDCKIERSMIQFQTSVESSDSSLRIPNSVRRARSSEYGLSRIKPLLDKADPSLRISFFDADYLPSLLAPLSNASNTSSSSNSDLSNNNSNNQLETKKKSKKKKQPSDTITTTMNPHDLNHLHFVDNFSRFDSRLTSSVPSSVASSSTPSTSSTSLSNPSSALSALSYPSTTPSEDVIRCRELIFIPFLMMYRLKPYNNEVEICCKDFRTVNFTFKSSQRSSEFCQRICLFFPTSETEIFAFRYAGAVKSALKPIKPLTPLSPSSSFLNLSSASSTLDDSKSEMNVISREESSTRSENDDNDKTITYDDSSIATTLQIDAGWKIFSSKKELQRILGKQKRSNKKKTSKHGWKIVKQCNQYSICDTYPRYFAIPEKITDQELLKVKEFRSRGRLPALCWLHPTLRSSLTRASQPKVGLRNARSPEDERFLLELNILTSPQGDMNAASLSMNETSSSSSSSSSMIVNSNNSGSSGNISLNNNNIGATSGVGNVANKPLYLLDARPKANAMANQAVGAGFEDTSRYKQTKLRFLNIPNIHVMRESERRLHDLCLPYDKSSDSSWLSSLEDSHWLQYIKLLLKSAVRIVDLLTNGVNVLIHCSDGWDRTSQLSALSMLMIDPYYRSIEGFIVLIEKEWLSFGHKFKERCGHIYSDEKEWNEAETSPIFLQFVDCVWQISEQFPTIFEFNSNFLIFILDHLNSGKYGTFLFNSEAQRVEKKLSENTISLWTYVLEHLSQFRNPFYAYSFLNEEGVDIRKNCTVSVIRPSSSMKMMKFWTDYYLRYDPAIPKSLGDKDSWGLHKLSILTKIANDLESLVEVHQNNSDEQKSHLDSNYLLAKIEELVDLKVKNHLLLLQNQEKN